MMVARHPASALWVLLGVVEEAELWTRSRNLCRAIHKAVTSEEWELHYRSKGDYSYTKPFMPRNFAEAELGTEINRADFSEKRLHFAPEPPHYENSLIAEYAFNLLVRDGVLVHPRVKDFRPVRTVNGYPRRVLAPADVWAVDRGQADEWLAVRLLLLERSGI